jgi:hypothetical protein
MYVQDLNEGLTDVRGRRLPSAPLLLQRLLAAEVA